MAFKVDKKKIVKKIKPQLKKMAEDISRDLEKKSLSAITEFYMDYDPYMYTRKYVMPFILNSAKTKEKNEGYEVRMSFNSNDLDRWHGDRADRVFEGPFIQGYHGGPIPHGYDWYTAISSSGRPYLKAGFVEYEPAPRMVPSPWEKIRDYAIYMYNAKVE